MHIDITRSSMIKALDYNEASQELIVTFTGGGQYKYFDVPKSEFEKLLTGDSSIGKYFAANIKNKYRCEKI